MAELNDQIKIALDEARTLVLGTQVLLGFEYQAVFHKKFEQFPYDVRCLKLASLGLMLVTLVLLMVPTAYHRLVLRGESRPELRRVTTRMVAWAVFPFALGLGADFSLAFFQVGGAAAAIPAGIASGLIAMFFWYGLGYGHRWRVGIPLTGDAMQNGGKDAGKTPLKDKVEHALTETRVVLPGAQALLGFQFAAMLMDGFEKLPPTAVTVHLISLALTALATIILITPAAYHRIAERGENTEHFHRFAGRMIVAAMAVLAPGVCGDLWVVAVKVTHSMPLATVGAAVMLGVFYSFWFGYTLWKRAGEHPEPGLITGRRRDAMRVR